MSEETTETVEPTLEPLPPVITHLAGVLMLVIVTGTVTTFGLAAYGAISLTKDVTKYVKRRFGGDVHNISSL